MTGSGEIETGGPFGALSPRAAPDNPTEVGVWRLRPLQRGEGVAIYPWIMDSRTAHRWTNRGLLVSADVFEHRLWEDSLVSLLVSRDSYDTPLAWISISGTDLHSGYCSAAVVVRPDLIRTGIGFKAALLLVRYAFSVYPFRRIYFESPEFSVKDFKSAIGRWLDIEGVLRGNLYYAGSYWDKYILTATRERWDSGASSAAERILSRGQRLGPIQTADSSPSHS